ncbi:MAG: hypothetical protein ACOVQR_04780 [Flavobacterium sp.]|jgi:hypothetical protein|uniref:hypothetical protein n=1 Tax=Flavobacterium sp. TaxID=239 RepID=UPI003BA5F16D
MKKIIFIPILTLFLLNCSDNNNQLTSFDITPILGKWEYVEYLGYDPPGPYLIDNGPIIELKADGTFVSPEVPNYPNGTFSVSSDSIITFTSRLNATTYSKKQIINFYSETEMILDIDLSPPGQIGCIEGCAERYAKVD